MPQLALEVHAWPDLHVMPLQVPEHSVLPVAAEQLQVPLLQVSPVGQSKAVVHPLSWHLPTAAPLQL